MTEVRERQPGNVANYSHPYVGRKFIYLPGMPSQVADDREDNLILRAGDTVRVIATFTNWNGVDGLDMLYIDNLSAHEKAPSTNTHVTPAELGVLPLQHVRAEDFAPSRGER